MTEVSDPDQLGLLHERDVNRPASLSLSLSFSLFSLSLLSPSTTRFPEMSLTG